jgi:hypothetical protein
MLEIGSKNDFFAPRLYSAARPTGLFHFPTTRYIPAAPGKFWLIAAEGTSWLGGNGSEPRQGWED